jgi:hypothetical protein
VAEASTRSGTAGERTPLAADGDDDAGTSNAQSPTCSLNGDAADESPPWGQTLAPGSGGKADVEDRGTGPLTGEHGLGELRRHLERPASPPPSSANPRKSPRVLEDGGDPMPRTPTSPSVAPPSSQISSSESSNSDERAQNLEPNGFADDTTRAGEENPAPAASRRCGSPETLASPSASRELQATVIFRIPYAWREFVAAQKLITMNVKYPFIHSI